MVVDNYFNKILSDLNNRQNAGYYKGRENLNFENLLTGANTQAARDSVLGTLRDYDDYSSRIGNREYFTGIGQFGGTGAYDLGKYYFDQNPLASVPAPVAPTPTPTPAQVPMLNEKQAGQLGQIKGIASDVSGLGTTQGQIKTQTDKIGGIASDVSGLGTTQQQILGRQGDISGLPGQTLAGGIGGLYSDRATASGITGLETDISGQTTTLSDLIKAQAGILAENQAGQTANLESILGNVGKEGTLATQLATRANTLDQGIERLQGTGDTAATSLARLLKGQDTLGGNIGGLATDFGDFSRQYTDDQADARTFRTTARDSLLGGQQQIQKAMGGNLGQRIDQVARNVDRQRTDQQQDFAGVARLIAANAPPQTQQDLVERGRFRESLDKIRSAIQSNPNIDQGTRATYSALVNSFDANGKLNAVSVKQDGGLISRSFDDQGQVVINQLGPQGEDMGVAPLSLNVNQLLNDAAAGGVQQQQQLPAAPMGQVSNDSGRFNRSVQGIGAPQV